MKFFTFVAIVFSVVFQLVELPQLLLRHLLHPNQLTFLEIAELAFYTAGVVLLLYHIWHGIKRLMERDMVETGVVAVSLLGMLVTLAGLLSPFWFVFDPTKSSEYGWLPIVLMLPGMALAVGGNWLAGHMDFSFKLPTLIYSKEQRLKDKAHSDYVARLPYAQQKYYRARPSGGLAAHMVD